MSMAYKHRTIGLFTHLHKPPVPPGIDIDTHSPLLVGVVMRVVGMVHQRVGGTPAVSEFWLTPARTLSLPLPHTDPLLLVPAPPDLDYQFIKMVGGFVDHLRVVVVHIGRHHVSKDQSMRAIFNYN